MDYLLDTRPHTGWREADGFSRIEKALGICPSRITVVAAMIWRFNWFNLPCIAQLELAANTTDSLWFFDDRVKVIWRS
jgi:hypothetical protein